MIYASSDIESLLWNQGYSLVCGVDEVGRGCFAGPVAAGAVIFSPSAKIPEGIADSKLLKPKQREDLSRRIEENCLAWSVGLINVNKINESGIGVATQLAYLEAINKLAQEPDFFLIDAFFITGLDKSKQKPIKNGDKLSVSIAAASIVAKVFRDNLMTELEKDFPGYGLSQHKGYGTKAHREAIKKLGLTNIHRKSFNLGKYA